MSGGAAEEDLDGPERHARLAAHFDDLADADAETRRARLDAIARRDPSLAAELRALLATEREESAALDRPALDWTGDDWSGDDRTGDDARGALPETLGGYRILGELGRGGMGVVLLAEQDRPRRRVALKLLRPGLLSVERIGRFEREADLLARLDHPSIARVFEVGTLRTDGVERAFMAMELVEGVPLTAWARDRGASLRERVEVLERVASAVAQCHARGIVHRDLKAANVLVTEGGLPKVLDFGVARALDDSDAGTVATATGQVIGTLHAMSPEQIRGDGAAVDARSDVYALGVLAYEVLAGERPYETAGLGLPEAARVVTETEPAPLRARDPDIPRDLEAIVARALEKEPRRRYASAGELSADLRRFLDERPVRARRLTRSYRAAKYLRRNRAPVAAAGAIVAALALGLVGTATQAAAAREAAARAEERLARATEVTRLVDGFFASVDPELEGADARVLDVLARAETVLDDPAARSPLVVAALHQTIGRAYQGLGRLQDAEEHLGAAVALRREHGAEPRALAESLSTLARMLRALSGERPAEVRALLVEARDLLRASEGAASPEALRVEVALARLDWAQDASETALPRAQRALEQLSSALPPGSRALESARLEVAAMLSDDGRFDGAEVLLRRSLDARVAAFGEAHLTVAEARRALGDLLLDTGELDGARAEYERALEVAGERLQDGHPDLALYARSLGEVERLRGRPAEAVPLFERYLATRRDLSDEPNRTLISALLDLGGVYLEAGRPEDARPLVEEAAVLAVPESGVTLEDRVAIEEARGILASWEGDLPAALEHQRAANALLDEGVGDALPSRATGLFNEGVLLCRLGRAEEAIAPLREAFGIERRMRGREHPFTVGCANELGHALIALERWQEALEVFRPQPAALAGIEGEGSRNHFVAVRSVAHCLLKLDRFEDALSALEPLDGLELGEVAAAERAFMAATALEGLGRDGEAAERLAPWLPSAPGGAHGRLAEALQRMIVDLEARLTAGD